MAGTVVAPSVLDLAGDPVGDPDLEVRRGQLEAGVLGLEQDVGQDRQRAPVGDGAADDRQAARQVLLHDREFHVGFTPIRDRSGRAAGRGFSEDRGDALVGHRPEVLVGIFSLSSHPVITVVMVWTRWTALLGRASRPWTTGRDGGRAAVAVDAVDAGGRRGRRDRTRRPVDRPRRAPAMRRRCDRMSTTGAVVHRFGAVVHSRGRTAEGRPRVRPTAATPVSRRRSARGRPRSRAAARR